MGRLSHLKRNAGWGGLAKTAATLALITAVPLWMGLQGGDWRAVPVVVVALALPVLAREALVREVERTGALLRYGGYAVLAAAFGFPFVQEHVPERAEALIAFTAFAAVSLYISTYVTVLSDRRVGLRDNG